MKHHCPRYRALTHANWKEESIKTRIETSIWLPRQALIKIEKKNPLKQGLKLVDYIKVLDRYEIEKKNPLKQGLKHSDLETVLVDYNNWKEESIKTRIETVNDCAGSLQHRQIEKKNPLKQGLKLLISWMFPMRL